MINEILNQICKCCNISYSYILTKNTQLYYKLNYCSFKCFKESGEIYKISNEKRVKKLQESGYHKIKKIETYSCIVCKADYLVNINKDSAHKIQGCCSMNCFKKTDIRFMNIVKTMLINNSIIIEGKSKDELLADYSIIKSNITKKAHSKWLKTNTEKYGEDFASIKSLKSAKDVKLRFLIKNCIIDKNNSLDESEINNLYITNFNKITNHGTKIKNGRMAKYDNSEELYKDSYKLALKKTIDNKIKECYKIDELSENEYIEIFTETKKQYYNAIKIMKKENPDYVNDWKKTHLINTDINIDNLNDSEISILYSEYLSNRITILTTSIHNGYARTKKGWYEFISINKKMFYRSSWELECLKTFDILIEKGEIIDINEPKPIKYYYEYNRHYFPDFDIIYSNGNNIIYEIKPKFKINEIMNQSKFNSARELLGERFIILTEDDIFSDSLEELLLIQKNKK